MVYIHTQNSTIFVFGQEWHCGFQLIKQAGYFLFLVNYFGNFWQLYKKSFLHRVQLVSF